MLQNMDHMEACCIMYVKVGGFNHHEQGIISILTVTMLGIVILPMQHDLMFRVWSIYLAVDLLRQTTPELLSVDKGGCYLLQK